MRAWSVLRSFAPLCVLGKLAGVVAVAVPGVYHAGAHFGGMAQVR